MPNSMEKLKSSLEKLFQNLKYFIMVGKEMDLALLLKKRIRKLWS